MEGAQLAVKGSTLLEYTYMYGWTSLPGQFVDISPERFVDISPGRFVANGHSKHFCLLSVFTVWHSVDLHVLHHVDLHVVIVNSQNARNTRHKTRHFSETHLMNTPALWQSRRDKSHSNRSIFKALQSSRHGSCLVLLILPANSLPQPTILKFVFFSLLSPIIYIA